jgi:hypothetical protein
MLLLIGCMEILFLKLAVTIFDLGWQPFLRTPYLLELSSKSPCLHRLFRPGFTSYPLFEQYSQSNEILWNLIMKCWNSAFNAQGLRVIIIVVQVGRKQVKSKHSFFFLLPSLIEPCMESWWIFSEKSLNLWQIFYSFCNSGKFHTKKCIPIYVFEVKLLSKLLMQMEEHALSPAFFWVACKTLHGWARPSLHLVTRGK